MRPALGAYSAETRAARKTLEIPIIMAKTKTATVSTPTKPDRGRTRRKAQPSTSGQTAGVKRKRSLKLRTILVPVDFSEHSRAALNYAITLAQDFGGSIVVLHVLDPLLATGRLDSARLRQLKSSSRGDAEKQLKTLNRVLLETGVRAELLLRNGPATNIIVATAVARNADLIIMGSEGRTGLRRLLIGSVAERVVRHAHCPVLVVR
jgi:universal stress protein A